MLDRDVVCTSQVVYTLVWVYCHTDRPTHTHTHTHPFLLHAITGTVLLSEEDERGGGGERGGASCGAMSPVR